MLDPGWTLTRPILAVALVALLGLLILRAVRRDRREYRRFKRYRSTVRRQAMYRRWLRDSFLTFGGLAAAALLLAAGFVAPLLTAAQAWPPVRAAREWIVADPGIAVAAAAGLLAGFAGLTVAGVFAARAEGEVPTVGDIRALLPRNRQELRLGALLSVNAGVVEELAFRLALPALLFGVTGNAVAAVVGSVLLFAALHAYQGLAGVAGTAVMGALLMAAYLLSGSILVPIVLHALFDLRSMVLIPVAVFGAHRIDGRRVLFAPRPTPVAPAEGPARSS